jgi:hypothetical protein
MAMQAQMRVMWRTANRLVHEKTAATAAAAHRNVAGEALREHRPAWNARGVLADDEAAQAPQRLLAPMPKDTAKKNQPCVALESCGAALEHEALGELGVLLGDGQAVESEELRAVAAAYWRTRRRARSRS